MPAKDRLIEEATVASIGLKVRPYFTHLDSEVKATGQYDLDRLYKDVKKILAVRTSLAPTS